MAATDPRHPSPGQHHPVVRSARFGADSPAAPDGRDPLCSITDAPTPGRRPPSPLPGRPIRRRFVGRTPVTEAASPISARPWFCPSSSIDRKPKQFPLIQTKIVDFFRIQRSSDFEKPGCRKRRKRLGALLVARKKRRLLPFNPSDDPNRRLQQMASLATALMTTGARFCDELTYSLGMAPRSANRAALEQGGMQVLTNKDNDTLSHCKKMMEMGECPPLSVVFDACEGMMEGWRWMGMRSS